jgi:hypothetical protein
MGQTSILTKLQKRFLDLVIAEPTLVRDYYWTGGTVLSEFYLHHRDSEDVDLFTEKAEVQIAAINTFINQAAKKIGSKQVKYVQFLGLHTFIFEFPDKSTLKVDFNYYPFHHLEKCEKYNGLSYDSVLDIAVNKMQTIATKPRSRDFVDLYMIQKTYGYDLTNLMKKARLKFDWYTDPIQLAAKFLLSRQVSDLPKMRISLPEAEWRDFFLTQAKALQDLSFNDK